MLKAGIIAAAGEGIVALERDRRVARALDAEGGVVVGLNLDIVQRHVEGVVIACGLIDDFDDVVGDVFGCVLEVFRSTLQDRGRFVPGLFVVIVVGDLEGCTGVRELAFGRREAALRAFRAFRAFGRGLAAGGGSAARLGAVAVRAGGVVRLVLVFLAAGSVVRLVLVSFAAGSVVGLVLVFLAAGGIVGLVLVFLAVGSVVGLVLVFLAAGGVVRLVLVFLAAGGVVGLVLVFLAAGGVVRLVLVFLAAGGVVRLVFVFLVAVVRRHVALGGAEVDHVFVFVFAVF